MIEFHICKSFCYAFTASPVALYMALFLLLDTSVNVSLSSLSTLISSLDGFKEIATVAIVAHRACSKHPISTALRYATLNCDITSFEEGVFALRSN